MTSTLDFHILGPLEVRAGTVPVPIAGHRQRTVLAMLLTSADRVVSVDALVEAVWDVRPPATCRTQIAICVAGLRRTLREAGCDLPVVVTARPGYRLVLGPHRLDAHEFMELVERARQAARQSRLRDGARLFAEALGRWRGPALADIRSGLVRSASTGLDEEWLSAHEQYTSLRLELGEHQALIGELSGVVRRHPLREQPRAALMLAYYRSGRRAEALATFHEGRRRIIDELGLEPGPVLRDMHEAILRDSPAIGLPAQAAPALASVESDTLYASAGPPGLSELDGIVNAQLEQSYRALAPEAAAMFRRLALLEADAFDVATAAALLDIDVAHARDLLERLVDAELIDRMTDRSTGGFRLSGVRRLYALARAHSDDRPRDLWVVRTRLANLGQAVPNPALPIDAHSPARVRIGRKRLIRA